MMRYLPHTDDEVAAMLDRVGVGSVADLFEPIPEANRCKGLNLEPQLDEFTLMTHLRELSEKNEAARSLSFLGGGMYDHHIPPAMDQLLLRSEFYTAYTPYQAEVAQGTLQAIFEFQSMVCQLFGTDVANASMYCAASGAAEAVLMARRSTRRSKILVSSAIHPHYAQTIRTYLSGVDSGTPVLEMIPVASDGRTDLDALREAVDAETAAVVVGYPNFFGCIEDLASIASATHDAGALLVTATSEPYALSLIEAPGHLGADICVGEGQAMAVPPQLGGPGVGLFSCSEKLVRQMPGRLVGETVDQDGERGFVLTLSTREQHIRREKATSNICTNHGLIALAFTIRTAMLGRRGFVDVGKLCVRGAEYLKAGIAKLDAYELPFSAPTFNEFVVRRRDGAAAPLLATLAAQGVLAGIDLSPFDFGGDDHSHDFLVAVTEKHTKADLDHLLSVL